MKATVTKVTANGTWEAHDKTFHKFEITIGEHTGEYSTNKFTNKDADDFPFKIGQEAEYEYVPHEKFPKIKLPPKSFYSGGKSYGRDEPFIQQQMNRRTALMQSIETVKIMGITGEEAAKKLVSCRDEYYKWLNDN